MLNPKKTKELVLLFHSTSSPENATDCADLTSKLTIAQNNLPGYHNKVNEAVSDPKNFCHKSSEQASKAVDGDVGDAKKAKRNAKSALNDAKDVRNTNGRVKDQEKKIANLSIQLEKK